MHRESYWACYYGDSRLGNRRRKYILRELGCEDVGWMDGTILGSSHIATFGIGGVGTSSSTLLDSVS
jgi:hypothetical protein